MASSSSSAQARSIVSPKLYDVFISHRGPDVKETLAKQLYDDLQAKECTAFLDREEIEGGDSILSAIHNAICSSRVQIAIFSKGYAQSPWCLNELVLMLEQTDALFIPVFYDVRPLELRYIENDKSQYAAAFADYQSKGRNLDKLDGWKKALASAADISGYELSQHPDDLCEKIVSRVVQVVEKKKSIPLHVAKYPVGLDKLVQDFERCCSKTAGMVGIFGLGGSGKTTLAKELFNKKRSDYQRSSFLFDVRESHARGAVHSLQRQLLKDLFSRDEEISSVHHGIRDLKDHLGRAKHLHFLIVLDDIDHQDQLEALLTEDMRDSDSLVIITTRDQSVLRGVDSRYKMRGMDWHHARDLFCSHAFRGRDPPTAYQKLVESFVEFCGGLPLSLIVLGAHVYKRDENYWNLELEKVKKIQPADIMKRLKISFDGLDKEEKQIFIDIACLFNKKDIYDFNPITIWKASGWSAELALQTLQHKCLIERDEHIGKVAFGREMYEYKFEMHDHLRDLGRQMADELGPSRLWQPEVLRSMEAKGFKQILAETKGRCFHSFHNESLGYITYFRAETDLLWLAVRMRGVNKLYFPSWISLRKLHYLRLNGVKELWTSFQRQLHINAQATFELRELWLQKCHSLQKLPDSIQMLSHLEKLYIEETDTTSFVQSLKQLSNLRLLRLLYEKGDCFGGNSTNLGFCTSSRMDSLEIIQLVGLRNISKLVISGEMCPRLQTLTVEEMKNLKEIELGQIETLNFLQVYRCGKLETILGLSSLTGLQKIYVHECAVLKSHLNLAHLRRLQEIKISECPELQRVEGISEYPELQKIRVEKCAVLKSFLNLAHLRRLEHITITECPQLQRVRGMEELPRLKSLVIEVPDDRYAWALDYIHGLRTLSLKRIILVQKAMHRASSKLNASLFSEVIDAQKVSEIARGESMLEMNISLGAITIYALLVKSNGEHGMIDLKIDLDPISRYYYDIPGKTDQLITVLLADNYSRGALYVTRIEKGYKATVKVGEEGKALIVLQRIVDQLYVQRRVLDLAA